MRLVAGATMNDPWDVKSVRQPGQYLSCMKINGVPLLPPIVSTEHIDEAITIFITKTNFLIQYF